MRRNNLRLLAIAAGGAAGALLRYTVSGLAYTIFGEDFPWGTLSVNLIGCLLIGFLWQTFENSTLSPQLRALIFVGGLGAFTTFSTYGLESVNLLRDGQMRVAVLNILGSNLLGLVAVFLGMLLARWTAVWGR
ncbi:MAG: fluoride efflux transporter CrcB [Ardenticatenaceae bacterium]|nr:fluoride efflux transporter CrcB [Ardenticatenaceae bacterium]MCB9004381.1 fluoride efflux transporter CrcB [Ardenticatenaceae bacterium]